MSNQSRKYEDNYAILERITESLNKDEVGIDDLVEKTREALNAARVCMEILNEQKGEFRKLETEFTQLLRSSTEGASAASNVGDVGDVGNVTDEPCPPCGPCENEPGQDGIGQDDPF
ncbi:MAG TPA: exodeoxyribonuclease VII small subunit [Candidatus Deferrimicrobium sp.]|nr:exodeoxyribonuclease VII small subunit [Candidatus Deferrimicrobium sp.]